MGTFAVAKLAAPEDRFRFSRSRDARAVRCGPVDVGGGKFLSEPAQPHASRGAHHSSQTCFLHKEPPLAKCTFLLAVCFWQARLQSTRLRRIDLPAALNVATFKSHWSSCL